MLLIGAGAILLFVSLFLEWYQPGVDAWEIFEVWDLVLALLAVTAFVAVASRLGFGPPRPASWLIGPAAAALVIVALQHHQPAAADAATSTATRAPASGWRCAASILMAAGALLSVARISVAFAPGRWASPPGRPAARARGPLRARGAPPATGRAGQPGRRPSIPSAPPDRESPAGHLPGERAGRRRRSPPAGCEHGAAVDRTAPRWRADHDRRLRCIAAVVSRRAARRRRRAARRRAPAAWRARHATTPGPTPSACRPPSPKPGSPTATTASSRRRRSCATCSIARTTGRGRQALARRCSRPSTAERYVAEILDRVDLRARSSRARRATRRRCCASRPTPRPATARSIAAAARRAPRHRPSPTCAPAGAGAEDQVAPATSSTRRPSGSSR